MSIKEELRGIYVIAQREFFANVTTVRLLLLTFLFGITMISFAYFDILLVAGTRVLPDQILNHIALAVIATMGPLLAIALSFDSITKEKAGNSLDLLLCRPLTRRGVALGKFLGVVAALVTPLSAISLLVILSLPAFMGEWPSLQMTAGFVFLTVLLIAIYALLQLTISTISETSGTAILSGVGLWLAFNIVWIVVYGVVSILLGERIDLSGLAILDLLISVHYSALGVKMALFNPGGLFGGSYNLAIRVLTPGDEIAAIPGWLPFVVLAIWFVIALLLAIEVFNRRANA